jgi:hypothetical protein
MARPTGVRFSDREETQRGSRNSRAVTTGNLTNKNERVNKKDYPTYEKETKSADAFRKEFKEAKKDGKDSFSFEGRKYNTDEEPALAKGGYVNCGASVPPAQKAKK